MSDTSAEYLLVGWIFALFFGCIMYHRWTDHKEFLIRWSDLDETDRTLLKDEI